METILEIPPVTQMCLNQKLGKIQLDFLIAPA